MKLIITDSGEESVGIFSATWQVECPFNKEDVDEYELEAFRINILDAYAEFAETNLSAEYDFEIQAEIEKENEMFKHICDGCNVSPGIEHKCWYPHIPSKNNYDCDCELCHPKTTTP